MSWVGRNHIGGTAYTFDLADRMISAQIETSNSPELWSWVYNAASQVKSKSSSNSAYDQHPAANSTDNRVYDALNRDVTVTVMSGGSSSVAQANSYDANQNQTLDGEGARNFVYDAQNKLVAVTGAGTSANIALSYDPLGRLYQEVATSGGASTTTQFLYSGDKLVAEYNGSGVMQMRYLHGPGVDQPLAQFSGSSVDGTTAQFLYADRQGSIVGLQTLTTGQLGTPLTYGPYGEPSSWTASRFGYTGQIALYEARLNDYKARDYDPFGGRFLQTDPVGYKSDLDAYAYTHEDPLNGSDPTGLADKDNKDEAARTCGVSGSSCGVVVFNKSNSISMGLAVTGVKVVSATAETTTTATETATAAGGMIAAAPVLVIGAALNLGTPGHTASPEDDEAKTTVYRIFGGAAGLFGKDDAGGGTYFSLHDPRGLGSKDSVREAYALPPEWGNNLSRVAVGYVNTRYLSNMGPAAPQRSVSGKIYFGGGIEVTIKNAASHVTIVENSPSGLK